MRCFHKRVCLLVLVLISKAGAFVRNEPAFRKPPVVTSMQIVSHKRRTSPTNMSMLNMNTPSIISTMASSLKSSGSLTKVIAGLRGGALDMSTEGFRMEAIGGYAVIASLTLGVCFDLLTSTNLQSKTSKIDNIVGLIFTGLVATSIVCGAFTSVLFTLLTLYSNTALGFGGAEGSAKYLAFMKATAKFRLQGFYTFLVAIYSFLLSFACSLFLRLEDRPRYVYSFIVGGLILMSMTKVNAVINIASTVIFS
mmetsp:Transcript_20965/g.31971  ORF Transcript_20965/g.31971 Transcript_20965/m.31971 type:complete len:252 (-) Transcript_20965:281-1036(-)